MNNSSTALIEKENEKKGHDWYIRRLTFLSPFLRTEGFEFELRFYRRVYIRVFRDVICPRIASSAGDSTHSFNFMFMGDMLSLRKDFYTITGINRFEKFTRGWLNAIPSGRFYDLTGYAATEVLREISRGNGSMLTGEMANRLVPLVDTVLRESEIINDRIDDDINYSSVARNLGAALSSVLPLEGLPHVLPGMMNATWGVFWKVIKGSAQRSPLSIGTVDKEITSLLRNHPRLVREKNMEAMEVVAEYSMKWLQRGVDASFFLQMISSACTADPEMTATGNTDALVDACENLEHFSRYGLIPLCYPYCETSLPGYIVEAGRIARGKSIDFSSLEDGRLFSGLIMSMEPDYDMDHLRYLQSPERVNRQQTGDTTDAMFSPVTLRKNGFEDGAPSLKNLSGLMNIRDTILDYLYNDEAVRDVIRRSHQLSLSQRVRAAIMYEASPDECRHLVQELYDRLLKNFQWEYVRLIEIVTWVYVLLHEPETRVEVESPDLTLSVTAMRRLLSDFYPVYLDRMLTEIQKKTALDKTAVSGDVIPGEADIAAMPLTRRREVLEDYRQLLVHVLQMRSFLNDVVRDAEGHGALPEAMRAVKVVSRDGEGCVLSSFAPSENRQYFEIVATEGNAPGFRFHVEELTPCVSIRRYTHTLDLALENGRFVAREPVEDIPGSILHYGQLVKNYEVLNHVMTLGEEEVTLIRNTIIDLEKRLIPLQVPVSPVTRGCIEQINDTLRAVTNTSGNDSLLCIPSKGLEMEYAFIFGGDCNRWDISQFLSHPDSHFFKVIHGERWCGYAAVLEVTCAGYGAGLLIDVFAVDTSASLPWLDLYRVFLDYCADAAVRNGFNCVVIPDEKLRISSHHNISGPVLEYFGNCEKIDAGGCVMREPVLSFQSLQTGYLVTWKRGEVK